MSEPQPITELQAQRIGYAIGEPLVLLGHPLTCNGGNPDYRNHHKHQVNMLIDDKGLICPECGRRQKIPAGKDLPEGWAW